MADLDLDAMRVLRATPAPTPTPGVDVDLDAQRAVATRPPATPGRVPPPPPWLRRTEEYVGKPLAMTAGIVAAAPLAFPLAPIPGVGPGLAYGTEMGAAGLSNALADIPFQALNKALGYRGAISGQRFKEQAMQGALAVPLGDVAGTLVRKGGGFVLKHITGSATIQRAQQKAVDVINEHFPEVMPTIRDTVASIRNQYDTFRTRASARAEASLRKEVAKRQEGAVSGMLGVTPEQAATRTHQVSGLGQLFGGQAAAARDASVGVQQRLYERVQGVFGKKYDALYEPVNKEPAPEEVLATLRDRAAGILSDSESFQTLAGGVRSVLGKMATAGDVRPELRAQAEKEVTAVMGGGASPQAHEQMVMQRVQQLASQQGITPNEEVTFGQLRQWQSDLRPFFTRTGSTRHAASEGYSAVMDALAETPRDSQLNAAYKIWRNRWTRPTLNKLYTAETPGQLGKDFYQPLLFRPLWEAADPGEQDLIRRNVEHWVTNQKLTPRQVADTWPIETLNMIFPGMGDKTKWLVLDAQADSINKLMRADPQLAQTARREAGATARRIYEDATGRLKKHILSGLDKFGPSIRPLRHSVAQMSGPQAWQFYNHVMLDPNFQNLMLTAAKTNAPVTWPQVAQRASWLVPLAIGELVTRGHMGTYTVGGALAESVISADLMTQRAFAASLRSRQGFQQMRQLLARPATRTTVRKIAKIAGRALALDALNASDAMGDDTPQVLDQPPPLPEGQ